MRILLTGARGMVGSNILEHNKANEYEIMSPPSSELDLCNYTDVRQWIKKHKPDLVIHAAGKVGGIQANIHNPVKFLLDNLDMGRNVIMASYSNGISRLINLGSSCMYPRYGVNPLNEEQILKGELEPTNEGYALAKIMVARLCDYISRESPEYQYKTLIPCNIYGRFDSFDPSRSHMVPAIIHKLHEAKIAGDKLVNIWGDGMVRREFMYAGDLADCVWRAVEKYENLPSLMNIGIGSDLSVNEYYRCAAEVIGYEGDFNHDLLKPVGMQRKLVDTQRVEKWGWKANTSLSVGLMYTYNFYLERYQK